MYYEEWKLLCGQNLNCILLFEQEMHKREKEGPVGLL